MNWYKYSQQQYLGYKIVGFDGSRYFSIYDTKTNVDVSIGSICAYKNGLYLGNSEQFCLDYYTGGTDFQDALLTYKYDISDLIRGDPQGTNGEVVVKKATLQSVKVLPKDEDELV